MSAAGKLKGGPRPGGQGRMRWAGRLFPARAALGLAGPLPDRAALDTRPRHGRGPTAGPHAPGSEKHRAAQRLAAAQRKMICWGLLAQMPPCIGGGGRMEPGACVTTEVMTGEGAGMVGGGAPLAHWISYGPPEGWTERR